MSQSGRDRHAKRIAIARKFARRLKAELGPRVRTVTLFGSVARGEDGRGSDIDVLIEVSRRSAAVEDRVFRVVSEVAVDHGELIVPLVLSTAERRRYMPGYLSTAIRREGRPLA